MSLATDYAFQVALETAFGDGGSSFTDVPVFSKNKPELEKEIHETELYQNSLSRNPFTVGMKKYNLDTEFYLKGSGAAGTASELSKLLQIFGLKETVNAGVSVVYIPDDAVADKSAGIKVNVGGKQYYMKGVRGSLIIPLEAGKPVVCAAKLIGLYNTPTAVTLPTLSFTDAAVAKPIVQTMALTLAGNTHSIKRMTINLNNIIEPELSINAAAGQSGINDIPIVRREWFVEYLVKIDSANDLEAWAAMEAGTEQAVASTGFGSAGNKHAFAIGATQIEDLEEVEEAGQLYYQIKARINKNASEFSYTQT